MIEFENDESFITSNLNQKNNGNITDNSSFTSKTNTKKKINENTTENNLMDKKNQNNTTIISVKAKSGSRTKTQKPKI